MIYKGVFNIKKITLILLLFLCSKSAFSVEKTTSEDVRKTTMFSMIHVLHQSLRDNGWLKLKGSEVLLNNACLTNDLRYYVNADFSPINFQCKKIENGRFYQILKHPFKFTAVVSSSKITMNIIIEDAPKGTFEGNDSGNRWRRFVGSWFYQSHLDIMDMLAEKPISPFIPAKPYCSRKKDFIRLTSTCESTTALANGRLASFSMKIAGVVDGKLVDKSNVIFESNITVE
jgi:hypothetical protein